MKETIIIFTLLGLLAGCQSAAPPVQVSDDPPTVAVTHWTEKTELFMEYPPLVAAEKVRSAIHLTGLEDFQALTEGSVVVELRRADGKVESFSTDGPSRPGIFGVDITPSQAGDYTMTVQLGSRQLDDTHELDSVTVYASVAEAVAAVEEEGGGEAISFLKEQQWTLDFATAIVEERSLREGLRIPTEVRPRTGGEAEVIAPVAGRLFATGSIPALGTLVKKGQTLARLIPRSASPSDRAAVELAVIEATHELERSGRDRERASRLLAAGAAPSKRLEEARARETIAKAKLKAAHIRQAQYESTRTTEGNIPPEAVFHLRSPLTGVIAEAHATSGANVEEGETLFRIVKTNPVHVIANVPEADISRLRQLSGAELEVPGVAKPLRLGRPVSVGRIIDPETRTLNVIYQVSNRNRLLVVGQSVFLRLFISAASKAPAVPESAVVDDGGIPVVFVQATGESFERRTVMLGNRENGYVHVLEGVKSGERVVTRGAYLIRLAALSSQIPAHGHAH